VPPAADVPPDADALADMLRAGRAAWPEIDVDPEAYAGYARERAGEGGDPGALHAADLYLACAAAVGDPRAVAAFERRYIADVPSFLSRVERSPAAIEEVQQALRDLLFVGRPGKPPKIAEYSGRGALGSWLRVVALRVHHNLRRQHRDHAPLEDEGPPAPLAEGSPELALLRAHGDAAVNQALRDTFSTLSPRDRSLLRLHFLDGLNVDRLGLVFGVHRATAARWLAAAREQLTAGALARLRERLAVSEAELASLMGLLRSRLTVSLRGLLREPDGGAAGE
jgi:RNA polymerase sigma-70 factor (ECF subfamily)